MSVNVAGAGRAYFGKDNDGPELRYSQSGTAFLNFTIGYYQGKDNPKGYLNAVAFNDLAENIAASIADGDAVTFSGVLDYSTWEKDGAKRSQLKVRLFECGASLRWNEVSVLRSDGSSSGYGGGQSAPAPKAGDQSIAPW